MRKGRQQINKEGRRGERERGEGRRRIIIKRTEGKEGKMEQGRRAEGRRHNKPAG